MSRIHHSDPTSSARRVVTLWSHQEARDQLTSQRQAGSGAGSGLADRDGVTEDAGDASPEPVRAWVVEPTELGEDVTEGVAARLYVAVVVPLLVLLPLVVAEIVPLGLLVGLADDKDIADVLPVGLDISLMLALALRVPVDVDDGLSAAVPLEVLLPLSLLLLLVDDEDVALAELGVWLTLTLALIAPVDDEDADVHAMEPVPLVVPRRKGHMKIRRGGHMQQHNTA